VLNRINDKLADDGFGLVNEPIQAPRTEDFPGEMPRGSGRLRM
jgi:hypothetical protein